ncbi:MAG: hypothetical protein U0325_09115 [Polyangiales bacterium]
MRRVGFALLAVTLGCAASSARRRPPAYCVEPRPGARDVRTIQAAPASRVEVLTSADASDRVADEVEETPCLSPAPRIAALEGEIAQGLAAVAAPSADCRSACRAAGGVCTARDEICRLTGDESAAQPMDARCARARAACDDATRQRTERCPVCPAE